MSGTRDYFVRTADGVRLALHRLRPAGEAWATPVLLVPGTFTTRAFWLGARGQGFAGVLAAGGFDVWVLEPRGHGSSDRPAAWLMSDWIERDAPAAVRLVRAETGARDVHWVGHSAGGVVGAAYAGRCAGTGSPLRGLVLLGSPGPGRFSGPRRWAARAGHLVATALPRLRFPGEVLGLGPEHEPAGLVREWLGWNLAGAWRAPDGGDYLAGLREARLPVLAVAGAGDRLLAPPHAVQDLLERFGSPDRTLLTAGRSTGYRQDYGHAGLMIGRGAREEVWPRILEWLAARAERPEHGTLRTGHA